MAANVNIEHVRWALEELSDEREQVRLWLSDGSAGKEVSSFVEAQCILFDDSGLGYALETNSTGLGEQIVAAVAYVVGMLAVLEIVLVSCVVAPRKTEAVLRPVHEWARTNSRQIFIVFFVLIGVWQLLRGFGIA